MHYFLPYPATGARIYFSHGGIGTQGGGVLAPGSTRPAPQTDPPSPLLTTIATKTHMGAHSSGAFFIAVADTIDSGNVVLVTAPAVPSRSSNGGGGPVPVSDSTGLALTEYYVAFELDGRVHALAETVPTTPAAVGKTALNELATFSSPPREWFFITDFGTYQLKRRTPIETLLEILEATPASGDGSRDDLRACFQACGSPSPLSARSDRNGLPAGRGRIDMAATSSA